MRGQLLDRMIRIYGFENPIVIEFARLIETEISDDALKTLVEAHEEFPQYDIEDED